MSDVIATQGHGDVWVWAVAGIHGWGHGVHAAAVYVDVLGPVQSWPRPSQAAPLRRTGHAPHGLSTLERGSYTSPGQHNRADAMKGHG